MIIYQWARDHGIPHAALQDLLRRFGALDDPQAGPPRYGTSETAVQAALKLNASKAGGRLWRNNIGGGKLANGSYLRWGLANESKEMNRVIKSGDLIGIRPITITPAHVGLVIGQFVSREAKHASWRYTGTEHERAQLAWAELINSLGGDARFANRGDEV